MEPLPQLLRMTIYGERDHSGTLWTVCKDTSGGAARTLRVNPADARQDPSDTTAAFQGDSPRRGAHVARRAKVADPATGRPNCGSRRAESVSGPGSSLPCWRRPGLGATSQVAAS